MEADVARLQRRVQELEAENAEFKRENQRLRTENGALKEVVQRLDARIRALEHRLHRNSSNSSRPPSSDPPNAPPPALPESPSGRKPGGQPGHPPANRKPFPPDEVNHFVPVYPKKCHGCHRKIHASSLKKMLVWLQHQVVDLPPVSAEVTEYDCYAGACEHCGAWNVAEVPADVRGLIAGPRLQAVASLLSGRFRLSRREVEDALVEMFGPKADLCLGTIGNLEGETTQALAPVYEEAHQAAQAAPQANFDETGWREGRKKAWLWVMVTAFLTVFRVDRHRNSDAFEALAGSFKGVLSSDRWRTYMDWIKRLHQFCWAHLKRDFKSWEDLGGAEGKLGTEALKCEREVMGLWHRFKRGEISRRTLWEYLRPVQKRLRKILRRGSRYRLIAGTSKELLEFWPCLWVFTRIPGVEPTNNVGEQEIRPAVLRRKGSFGSHSPDGSRFVERMLTVVRSLRKQG
ncbi:MAG TPA: IS66 family transposase, partial [Planctomycetota bacterium]|nr:IS66 family transposase [Planctomycetota bacterium]